MGETEKYSARTRAPDETAEGVISRSFSGPRADGCCCNSTVQVIIDCRGLFEFNFIIFNWFDTPSWTRR